MSKNYNKINEKALMLLVYSFLKQASSEGKLNINQPYGRLDKAKTIKLLNVLKKLEIIKRNFALPKIQSYLLKQVEDPSQKYVVDVVYLAILLLYFYRLSDIKRTFEVVSIKDVKELIKIEDLSKDEIEVAKNFFVALYPDKEATIEFFINNLKVVEED